jgi:hypothetical protein
MKKECERARKAFPRYLHGHIFKPERRRIEQHLQQCVLCRSEFEALRRTEETRQFLKEINASGGVVGTVKHGVSSLAKLRKIIYRPLLLAAIALAAGAVSWYVLTPRQLVIEIESIVESMPTSSAAQLAPESAPAVVSEKAPAPEAPPVPAPKPLVIAITPENDAAAVLRINEIMEGHGQPGKMKFTDRTKELTGNMPAEELAGLLSAIEPAARVDYSRKRFESYPASQPIPFVLKLNAAPQQQPQQAPAEPAGPASPGPGHSP